LEEASKDDEDSEAIYNFVLEIEEMGEKLEELEKQIEAFFGELQKRIITNVKTEWNERESNLKQQQLNRNRGIIKEIISTCNLFREEVANYFKEKREEDDN